MARYTLIEGCDANDATGLAKNNMSAFWEEPWWRIQWGDRPLGMIIENATLRMPKNLLKDTHLRRHEKVIHSPTGHIAGYARWILPESHADTWLESKTPAVSERQITRYQELHASADWSQSPEYDTIVDKLYELQQKHEPEEDHLSKAFIPVYSEYVRTALSVIVGLDYLCVHPDHQGSGVAGMLVGSGIRQANRLGLPIYCLSTGSRALNLYEKHGFESIGCLTQDLRPQGVQSTLVAHCLIKHPDSSSKPVI